MPLIKNTETGNNYLEKTNTGGDACTRTAVRSYDKQDGADGGINSLAVDNTVFSLPFLYVPETHTLWVYVNGQKAEYLAAGGSTTEQLLQYKEASNQTVEFYYPLEDDDVVEFIVAGAYYGDTNDTLIPNLDEYKTRNDDNEFTTDQPMSSNKFTGLGKGSVTGDSIEHEQLVHNNTGSYLTGDAVLTHYHTKMYPTGSIISTDPVINTSTGNASLGNNKITNLGVCTASTDAANKDYVDGLVVSTPLDFSGTNCDITSQQLHQKYGRRLDLYTGIVTITSSLSVATFDIPFACAGVAAIQMTAWFDGATLFSSSGPGIAVRVTQPGPSLSRVDCTTDVNGSSFYFIIWHESLT